MTKRVSYLCEQDALFVTLVKEFDRKEALHDSVPEGDAGQDCELLRRGRATTQEEENSETYPGKSYSSKYGPSERL